MYVVGSEDHTEIPNKYLQRYLTTEKYHLIVDMYIRFGQYFDILIYRDISISDYPIQLSSCLMTIVILLRNMYSLQNP